jgi:hypothetical protein
MRTNDIVKELVSKQDVSARRLSRMLGKNDNYLQNFTASIDNPRVATFAAILALFGLRLAVVDAKGTVLYELDAPAAKTNDLIG